MWFILRNSHYIIEIIGISPLQIHHRHSDAHCQQKNAWSRIITKYYCGIFVTVTFLSLWYFCHSDIFITVVFLQQLHFRNTVTNMSLLQIYHRQIYAESPEYQKKQGMSTHKIKIIYLWVYVLFYWQIAFKML